MRNVNKAIFNNYAIILLIIQYKNSACKAAG